MCAKVNAVCFCRASTREETRHKVYITLSYRNHLFSSNVATSRITRKNGLDDPNRSTRATVMVSTKEPENPYGAGISIVESHDDAPFSVETSGLQPSELLNHEAMSGKFSMQRILDTQQQHGKSDASLTERIASTSTQDAIEIGLVSQSIAEHLLKRYLERVS
jgi:hypothetical protein